MIVSGRNVKWMTMDIGQAVKRLRSGDRIARAGWEDKDRFIDHEETKDTDDLDLTYEDLLADDWETVDG
jgi:hypothetical protein